MPTIWDSPFTQNMGGQASATGTGGGPSGTNLFYQQGYNYGATQNYNQSPLGEMMREKNPQVAYTQYAGNMGVGDTDSAFNRWFLSQYPKFERAYGLATLQNPFLTIDKFLATLPGLGQLQQQYQMLSPAQRGIQQSVYAPQVRWIQR